MKCPVDDETLMMTERGGVEIDYCPRCRGVWLDRGELDKIVERSGTELRAHETDATGQHREGGPLQSGRVDQRRVDREHEERAHDPFGERRPGKRKKESFLGELFDF